MIFFSKFIRRLSPQLYIRNNMAEIDSQIREINGEKRRVNLTSDEHNAIARLFSERQEFEEWADSIDEARLLKRAKKIGVYLDDIPYVSVADEGMFDRRIGNYHYSTTFGGVLLQPDFKPLVIKAVRERVPIYRKERREIMDINIRLITALTGVIGAAIGLASVVFSHHH